MKEEQSKHIIVDINFLFEKLIDYVGFIDAYCKKANTVSKVKPVSEEEVKQKALELIQQFNLNEIKDDAFRKLFLTLFGLDVSTQTNFWNEWNDLVKAKDDDNISMIVDCLTGFNEGDFSVSVLGVINSKHFAVLKNACKAPFVFEEKNSYSPSLFSHQDNILYMVDVPFLLSHRIKKDVAGLVEEIIGEEKIKEAEKFLIVREENQKLTEFCKAKAITLMTAEDSGGLYNQLGKIEGIEPGHMVLCKNN
jgi:hypothetical protein